MQTLIVEVADDGPGLPPDIRDYLERPEFGLCRSSAVGLGLWMVKRFCHEVGGRIEVADASAGEPLSE